MTNIKSSISLALFLVFFVSYILKLIVLYKRNSIKANVLVKGQKSPDTKYTELFVKTTTFIWAAAWFILSAAGDFAASRTGILLNSPLINTIGVLLTIFGILVFIIAAISMGTSWRVGIDKAAKTKLVTQGIYKYSRNPAFVGFDFMLMGFFLMYPSILTICISVINILALHLLILQEEKHLKLTFGEEYMQYNKNTPRYILFL